MTSTTRTAPDLSPRVDRPAKGNSAGAAGPSPEQIQLALPDELALGDILPPPDTVVSDPAAAGAGGLGDPGSDTASADVATESASDYRHAGRDRFALIGGLVVTLAILFFGGGFLWWRNRDSQYFPA